MSQSEIERFIAEQTIECKPMHARISRVQCGSNIRSGEFGYCASCSEAPLADMSGKDRFNGWQRSYSSTPNAKSEENMTQHEQTPAAPPAPKRKNITLSELSALCGVPYPTLYAIFKGEYPTGEKRKVAEAALAELGLTWEDIVSARQSGRYKKHQSAPAAKAVPEAPRQLDELDKLVEKQCDAIANAVSVSIPENLFMGRNPEVAMEKPKLSPEHEKAIDELFADDWEPEETPSPAPSFTPPAPNYARDFPLSHIPLEALVVEITRRMPRAEVVLR